MLSTLEDQELKENVEVMRNLQEVILELKVSICLHISLRKTYNVTLYVMPHVSLFVCFKSESAGIAATIEAFSAGEDGPEVSGNGSKNATNESPSVRCLF